MLHSNGQLAQNSKQLEQGQPGEGRVLRRSFAARQHTGLLPFLTSEFKQNVSSGKVRGKSVGMMETMGVP